MWYRVALEIRLERYGPSYASVVLYIACVYCKPAYSSLFGTQLRLTTKLTGLTTEYYTTNDRLTANVVACKATPTSEYRPRLFAQLLNRSVPEGSTVKIVFLIFFLTIEEMRTEQVIKWITPSTFYHTHFWTPHYFNTSDAHERCIV